MKAKERANRIHKELKYSHVPWEGKLYGIDLIDDMIDWCKKKEPGRLDYWNEVKEEYIKLNK